MRNWRSEKGNILVLTAILLPVLLGMGALAVDAGYLFDYQQRLTGIADAAAAAAADDVQWYASDGSATEATVKAQALAAAQYAVAQYDPSLTVVVNCPPPGASPASGQPAFTCQADGIVQVTVSKSVPTFLMRVLGTNAIPVAATATAASTVSDACVVALSTTGTSSWFTGLSVGSGASPSIPKCRAVSNSNASIAGNLTTKELDVTGTCSSPCSVTGTKRLGVPVTGDPMGSYSDASLKKRFSNCTEGNAWSPTHNMPSLNGANFPVDPGIYCSDGIHPALALLGSNGTGYRYTLSGVYNIVYNGLGTAPFGGGAHSLLEIGANTTVSGAGVTFYFQSANSSYITCNSGVGNLVVDLAAVSSNTGTVTVNSGGRSTGKSGYNVGNAAPGVSSGSANLLLSLQAPTTGIWSSLLFVQDRTLGNTCASSSAADVNLQHYNMFLDGMSYFPGQHVDFGGTQLSVDPTQPTYWGIIADTVTFTGGSLSNNGSNNHHHYDFDWHRFFHFWFWWF